MSSEFSIDFIGGSRYAVASSDPVGLKKERTDSFSVFCWALARNNSLGYMVGKYNQSLNRGFLFGKDGGGRIRVIIANSGSNRIFAETYAPILLGSTSQNSGFRFIGFTYDGSSSASGLTIYVDGYPFNIEVYDDTLSATIDNTIDFQVSGYNGGNANYVGYIDEVSLYNSELTSSEVFTLWNDGAPGDLEVIGPTGSLGEWWPMGDGDTHPTLSATQNSPAHDLTMTNMVAGDIISEVPEVVNLITYDLFTGGEGTITGTVKTFVMRGIDAAGPYPSYHYWKVTGSPDSDGSEAGSLPFGGPLQDIVVVKVY